MVGCCMKDYQYSDELYLNIIKTYLDTDSVKETAKALCTSVVKVRKVLITEGLWSSRTSQEVQHYLDLGKTTAEIADILCTTDKAVQQYLPYTKGIYKGDNPTVGALNTAVYRQRIRIAQENTLRRNQDIARKNNWIAKEKIMEKKEHIAFDYNGELHIPKGIENFSGFDPMRLHLELDIQNDSQAEKVLKQYGQVKYGKTITRDVLVPGEMPLWALHFVIQKCFGWQNSHLHKFSLSNDQFENLTNNRALEYSSLVGVLFRSPIMAEEELFWNDDYQNGSIKTWMRGKYTGPYESVCHGEGVWQCKQDMKRFKRMYRYAQVFRIPEFGNLCSRVVPLTRNEYDELRKQQERGWNHIPAKEGSFDDYRFDSFDYEKVWEVYDFEDLPLDVIAKISENDPNSLLERLPILEVIALHDKGIDDGFPIGEDIPLCFKALMDDELKEDIEDCLKQDDADLQPVLDPVTEVLHYSYDFGDDWNVTITASFGASDLIASGRLTQKELDEALSQMYKTYRPVCIAQDGFPVMDDVGGVPGYLEFLSTINGPADETSMNEIQSNWAWAKDMGWSTRRSSNKNLL